MTVRTAYAGTPVALAVLTAANFNKLPGGWIGHTDVTATQTGITSTVALTGLTVTVTVGTSRRIKVSGSFYMLSNVANDVFSGIINEGATVLQQGPVQVDANPRTVTPWCVLTPSAGTHTYFLSMGRAVGTGSGTLAASAASPCSILVEDMGPA